MKKLLKELMKDEKTAPIGYNKLLGELKTKKDKKMVHSIIRDERRHLKNLKKIKLK